jgi:two-component system, NtrC family, response regulator HydG
MGDSGPTAGRVLIIDDDRVFGLWATKALQGRDFYIQHVLDPVTGLRQIEAEPWDLVITDVEMPRMSGLEFLERARRLVPGLPVVVVTAHPTVDRAVTALRHAGTDFIHKPVTAPEFVARVTSLVAQHRQVAAVPAESVLAIGAHPGDVEIGAGGALLAHQAAGVPVTILTLSRATPGDSTPRDAAPGDAAPGDAAPGDAAPGDAAPGDAGPQGAGPPRPAAPVIGTRLYAGDLIGPDLEPGASPISAAIEKAVAQVRPTVLYTHSVHDSQPDHRDVHHDAMAATRQIARVYCFQSPSATIDFRPTHFVVIDDQLRAKLAAAGAYSAQPEVRDYLEPDQVTSTAVYWARYCNAHHAEAFEVVRELAGSGAAAPGAPGTAQSARGGGSWA